MSEQQPCPRCHGEGIIWDEASSEGTANGCSCDAGKALAARVAQKGKMTNNAKTPAQSGIGGSDAPERIVAAAIQCGGLTISLPQPARHAHVQWESLNQHPLCMFHQATQGFLTSEGRFATRIEARHIARRAGQAPRTTGNDQELFSEDLW